MEVIGLIKETCAPHIQAMLESDFKFELMMKSGLSIKEFSNHYLIMSKVPNGHGNLIVTLRLGARKQVVDDKRESGTKEV